MAVEAYWHGSLAEFLATDPQQIVDRLAFEASRRHRVNEAPQLRAWQETCTILRHALASDEWARSTYLLFEVTLPRTQRRADVVLLVNGRILVLEFKVGAIRVDTGAMRQAEDFALDLQDFHSGSRGREIWPVVVPTGAADFPRGQGFFAIAGVMPAVAVSPIQLIQCLRDASRDALPPLDPNAWMKAPYRPVPPIIEAACTLFARHSVEEILDARAGAASLAQTSGAIREAIATAHDQKRHTVVFVTGVPGAGKTLCGLNACFGDSDDALRATFLTGNPTLVHVLREALVRDAVARGANRRAVTQRMEGVIQALPAFRDRYVAHLDAPAERVVVIDEAQRSWSRAQAVRKSRDRAVQLTDSEPALLLAAMARHTDWAAMVCLIGNGQEIHDGEGGLAEWGAALAAAQTDWRIIASPECVTAVEARQRLPEIRGLVRDPRLHLAVPTRQVSCENASTWVNAVLAGDTKRAHALVQTLPNGLPFRLTRNPVALKQRLRQVARGTRRAGLVGSSGGRRLRAAGFGAELPHMDAKAVAHWFLGHWPEDVRASGALEVMATEFSVQGLELDAVGLCWDADLVRNHGAWQARKFSGTRWHLQRQSEGISNRINTYRVLLTRARRETVIYVPIGNPDDPTRDPVLYDGIAQFLAECGVTPL